MRWNQTSTLPYHLHGFCRRYRLNPHIFYSSSLSATLHQFQDKSGLLHSSWPLLGWFSGTLFRQNLLKLVNMRHPIFIHTIPASHKLSCRSSEAWNRIVRNLDWKFSRNDKPFFPWIVSFHIFKSSMLLSFSNSWIFKDTDQDESESLKCSIRSARYMQWIQ